MNGHRLTFLRGCGFGLNARIAMLALDLPHVGPERIAAIEAALREGVQVPAELWDSLELPDGAVAALFVRGYVAIAAHLRQMICWRGARIAGDGGAPATTLVLPYDNAPLARDLVSAVLDWLADDAAEPGSTLAAILERLFTAHRQHLTGPIAKPILGYRALQLGYPMFEDPFGILVIGEGARRRFVRALRTDRTAAIAMQLCGNKAHTALRLRLAGLPTVPHRTVASADEAVSAAEALGYPVVVKPADQERGQGVTNNLHSADEVREAWDTARAASEAILVERHVEGRTHRLTVVEGEVINAVRRIPAGVTGDGRRTIAELVAALNAEPQLARRRMRDGHPPLVVDAEALRLLARRGMDAASIPDDGTFVALRGKDNIRAGGRNEVLELADVHPDNLRLAASAADVMLADIAGIDLIIPDIGRSWREQTCTICEVNADPELGAATIQRPFARLLARLAGDDPAAARVPVSLTVVPAHADAAATTAEWTSAASGLRQGGDLVSGPFADGFIAARAALCNRAVSSLAIVMTAEEVLQSGLPSARFDRIVIDPAVGGLGAPLAMLCSGHGPVGMMQP